MEGKDFLSVADLTSDELRRLIKRAGEMKTGRPRGSLEGKNIALVFEKPSLRTRVSFEVGIRQMGGSCIYLSKDDLGLGVREPEADVARVLTRWVDGIVARVFSHRSLELLAEYATVPVINALSDLEHPCQALGDMLTILERRNISEGIALAFIGDGNNIASSLALACASLGINFTLTTPEDHKIPPAIWEKARDRASYGNSELRWVENPREAVRDADVVYTDVWVSMGQEDEREKRLEAFSGYQVDEELMRGAKPDALFMHDLPAHRGEEISDGMLEHAGSIVFDQAENRLHAQKAIMAEILCA